MVDTEKQIEDLQNEVYNLHDIASKKQQKIRELKIRITKKEYKNNIGKYFKYCNDESCGEWFTYYKFLSVINEDDGEFIVIDEFNYGSIKIEITILKLKDVFKAIDFTEITKAEFLGIFEKCTNQLKDKIM